jgi:hypothetical protein
MEFSSSKKLVETWLWMPEGFNREFRVELFQYDPHGSFAYSLHEKQQDGSFGHILTPGQNGGSPFSTREEALDRAKQNIERLGPLPA